MLMCRSPFQGLLFIYTSQSQPPRCQPGLWHGTHSHREGQGKRQEEGGKEIVLGDRGGCMVACSAFVKGSRGETLLVECLRRDLLFCQSHKCTWVFCFFFTIPNHQTCFIEATYTQNMDSDVTVASFDFTDEFNTY